MAGNACADQGDGTATNDVYFSSYEDLTVHELMIKDQPRTQAYKDFIEKNAASFKDKIVIDVGAGSGILSLFAAKAGAKKVYAIEASGLSRLCEAIVKQNKYEDVIQVVHGRVEDVSLPIDKADIIVSEWMGFYLLHEAMLSSVIVARDRWLSIDGLMLPSSASLYICPVQMTEYYKENFIFWTNAYGFDLSPMAELVKQKTLAQPSITRVHDHNLLAEPELITHLDLMYVGVEDLRTVLGSFKFAIQKNAVCHGFACWFDCQFESGAAESKDVVLSTGPSAEPTHWQQTVMFLPDAYFVSKGDSLSCQLNMSQDPQEERRYNIGLEIVEEESDEEEGEMQEESDEDEQFDADSVKQAVINAMQTNNS